MSIQEPPEWMRIMLEDGPPKRRPKAPTPKNMPPRKPSALAPKRKTPGEISADKVETELRRKMAEVKAETPRLHVRVAFQGSMTFCLEESQAMELRHLLTRGDADEILEALDPWASGASVRQTIDILEDPSEPGGTYYSWVVDEERGMVNAKMNRDLWGPFVYTIEGGGKPQGVEWGQVITG